MDAFVRGMFELHVWCAPWTSTQAAMRLDAWFTVSLCLLTVAGLMFTNALFYYAPFYGSALWHVLHAIACLTVVTALVGLLQVRR